MKIPDSNPYSSNPVINKSIEQQNAGSIKKNASTVKTDSLRNSTAIPPATFLKSKRVGTWLMNRIFGNNEQRAGDLRYRSYFLSQFSNEKLNFTTQDGLELKGTLVKPHDNVTPSNKTYIFCSGSFGCYEGYVRSFAREQPGVLEKLVSEGHQVLLYDYRGFGENKDLGQPSAIGICRDGEAAYKCIKERGTKNKDIVMYGYSMGGPVAAQVASNHKTDLVLDRIPADVDSVVREEVPIYLLKALMGKIVSQKFPLSTLRNLQNFNGKNLKIIIDQDGRKEDPRIKKFQKALKNIKRNSSECLVIFRDVPHIFTDDNPPTREFLKNIHFE